MSDRGPGRQRQDQNETPHAGPRANTHSRIRELRKEAAGATTIVAPTLPFFHDFNSIRTEARPALHVA
jgi:hypothetical protein